MLKSFCAAANLRALVQSDRCPDIIRSCSHLLDECYGQDQRGTLMNDLRILDYSLNDHSSQVESWDYEQDKFEPLEKVVYDALITFADSHRTDGWTVHSQAVFHKQHKIRGLQYAEMTAGGKNTRARHSTIFFQPEGSGQLVPGVVRKIFSIPRKQNGIESRALFLAVHRYKPLPDHVDDPFKRYEEFRSSLWSDERSSLEIVIPSQKICHATFCQWQEGIFVMRPIDRVSFRFLQYIGTTD